MKTSEQIEARIKLIKEMTVFVRLIRLDTVAFTTLKSVIKTLEWVLGEEET